MWWILCSCHQSLCAMPMVRCHKFTGLFRQELKKFGKPKLAPNAFMLFVRSSRLERGNAHPTVSNWAIHFCHTLHLLKGNWTREAAWAWLVEIILENYTHGRFAFDFSSSLLKINVWKCGDMMVSAAILCSAVYLSHIRNKMGVCGKSTKKFKCETSQPFLYSWLGKSKPSQFMAALPKSFFSDQYW